jgi:F-box-like
MDTTSPESRGPLRQPIIDEVINSLEASTRALKSRYNERSPISSLPCEVLTAIFSLPSVFAWNEGPRARFLAWINVAHVCRRWPETALNQPSPLLEPHQFDQVDPGWHG